MRMTTTTAADVAAASFDVKNDGRHSADGFSDGHISENRS